MNGKQFFFAFITVALCSSSVVKAMWANVPLEKLLEENPVVLVGRILNVTAAGPGKEKFDTAHILVEEVLKNGLQELKINKGDKIPLSMPAAAEVKASTDIRYSRGTQGVWILEYKDKTFRATYPKDLQPLEHKESIVQIIREQVTRHDIPEGENPGGRK